MSYGVRQNVPLIGYSTYQIVGNNNLPTIKQVLAVLFYNMRRLSNSLEDSAKLVIEECVIFYKKARIPTKKLDKCVEKLKSEYQRWRKATKNVSRNSDTQKKKEAAYKESLNKLFDISKANALEVMEDEDDKQFLRDQRGVPKNQTSDATTPIFDATLEKTYPMEVENENFEVEENEPSTSSTYEETGNVSRESRKRDFPEKAAEEELHVLLGPESQSQPSQRTPSPKRRVTEMVITPRLGITLDKCKVSKNDAMHLMMAAAEAFDVDTRNVILNAKSIHEARKKSRRERFEAIKKIAPDLFTDFSTIHWDGKLLPGLFPGERDDRLAIIITSKGMEQLLGVPKIDSSSGKNQAEAVYQTLVDWSMLKNVEALCCDSTSSNTGRINGACTILEQLLGKDLLYLICRHHLYELVLRCTFEMKFGKTTGPDVHQFKKFEDFWKTIDQKQYEIGVADKFVNESLQDITNTILNFCSEQLKKDQTRKDYKEFLELVVIFLGGELIETVVFHPPGPLHHARWMAKAIYCLKIFFFRKQFLLDNKNDEIKYRDVCIFIIRVYVQAWFCATSSAQAPNQDLQFLKQLYNYKSIDKSISEATVKKFQNHLWYLTPELAALAFFDSTVSNEEKLRMREALKSDCSTFVCKKRVIANEENVNEIVQFNLNDFICIDSNRLFERLKIDTSFLSKDPSTWNGDRNYVLGLEIVKNLKVVNDTAEREIKLITEFNNLLTRDDQQMQYLLPVIKEYKSVYKNSYKKTLMKSYEKAF